MTTSRNVTAFGIGNMGAALAHALLKADTKVTIWNRTVDRPQVQSVVEAGATLEADVKAAISGSNDILLFCLIDYDAMYKTLEPINGTSDGLAGKTIVNVTNGTPQQALEMSNWIKARGAAHYFDGAVLVTPQMVATPQSLLVYSGESQETFDDIKTLLQPLGAPLYYGSQVDAAAAQDLAMLATMYGMFYGAFVGFGILKRSGQGQDVKVAPGTKQITIPVMEALTAYLGLLADVIDSEDWASNGGNPLLMQVAGVANIIQAAKDANVNASGLEVLAEAMGKAVEDGWADGNVAAASKFI